MTIVCFGVIDWYYLRQRPQQLALALARRHTVIYAHPRSRLSVWRQRRELPAEARLEWRADAGGDGRPLFLHEPLLLPKHRGPMLAAANQRLFAASLHRRMARLGARPDWVWIGHPSDARHADIFPGTPVVYDCMDRWESFPGAAGAADAEKRLLERSAVVLASSRPLHERLRATHGNVHLVPNGVDHAHFRQALDRRARPAGPGRPVAITVGTLGPWIDFELVEEVARRMPQWELLLVGPHEAAGTLPAGPNIRWLGRRPYEEIPGLLASADVAFLPFHLNDLTRSVDPIKVYEFLAAGLPVVAPPLPELAKFGPGVVIARGARHFGDALDAARTAADDPGFREALSASVAGEGWEARADRIEAILAGDLAE